MCICITMKPKLTSDKLRGGYYTPEIISKFLSKLVVLENPKKYLNHPAEMEILLFL